MSLKKYYKIGKKKLFPICRSITGSGIRNTLKIIKNEFPMLKIHKVNSGKKVFDWHIPDEWNISDAYIIDKNKKKIVDFKKNNLHVVGYSKPCNLIVSKKKLLKHLHSLPSKPTAIPYITSYYKKYWGFCLSHNHHKFIKKNYRYDEKFKVVIKSKLNKKGVLNYGELIIKGNSKQEILISTYVCHPSMANNELSGPIVAMSLIKNFIKRKKLEKTLRFLFIPETIGSIAYLSKNLDYLKKNVVGGYNLSCIGDEKQHSCMFSKYGNALSDKALHQAYKFLKIKYKRYSFLERGSDERQYNSPGIDLPIASIFRTKYGCYPEYHTSLDNFKVVTLKGLTGGYNVAKKAIEILIKYKIPKNLILCEPKMDKRGLYPKLSTIETRSKVHNFMSFLQYSDGTNDLDSISKLLNLSFQDTDRIFNLLKNKKLIES